ncbi:(2Fe-2S)-binding protein [Vallicoccus soli]|uniref:(2Fe-2S)-binding protein n=1 Tax=Vallicoccus soli TaxID=2339232 RepID=A0A3A3Z3K8_9ACTN|nr:(2Fe-2S)-binding protein [Vallicoccus soli]RJK96125.1 (2Fe-2S)-binding protein [Vallicoccus soli]
MHPPQDEDGAGTEVSRRGFLGGGLAAAAAPLLAGGAPAPAQAAPGPAAVGGADDLVVQVRARVNGERVRLQVDPRATLLDTLRERLDLTGTKKGCDRGQCGACTVHVDGRRVLSCLTLAATVSGAEVTTVEGLSRGDLLHPVQQAFLEQDGFQCGFCTPGQVMSAVALLEEGPARSDDEVRERMSGNICRCSAYPAIVAAVRAAQEAVGR